MKKLLTLTSCKKLNLIQMSCLCIYVKISTPIHPNEHTSWCVLVPVFYSSAHSDAAGIQRFAYIQHWVLSLLDILKCCHISQDIVHYLCVLIQYVLSGWSLQGLWSISSCSNGVVCESMVSIYCSFVDLLRHLYFKHSSVAGNTNCIKQVFGV